MPREPLVPVNDREARRAASDEGDLIGRLRAGDDAAYEEMVRTHAGRMMAVAQRLMRHEEDARDVVQDAFLSAFRSLDRFQGDARLSTWLHRIVVNAALMRLRTRRRKPEESIEDLLPTFTEDGHQAHPASPWRETADRALMRREARESVREGIERLPESYRTVLVLRDIEGLDTEEAAEAMGMTTSAVKTRLHRARQALRQLLDPQMRETDA